MRIAFLLDLGLRRSREEEGGRREEGRQEEGRREGELGLQHLSS